MNDPVNSSAHVSSRRRARFAALLWYIVFVTNVYASPQRLSQMGHTFWRLTDGVFPGTPSAIAQTTDGYLWIGTGGGLTRFDGVRFVNQTAQSGLSLVNMSVLSLLGSRDGSLWIGTSAGVFRLKNGKATKIPEIKGWIYEIAEDPSGVIWVAQLHGKMPLCSISNRQVRCFGKQDGFLKNGAAFVATAKDGSIWIDNDDGVSVLTTQGVRNFEMSLGKPVLGLESSGFVPLDDGCAIVGFLRSGDGGGLQSFCNGRWKPYTLNGYGGTAFQVNSLYQGHDGTLWVGTVSDGLYRFQNGSVDHLQRADGLSSDCVQRIFEDREGTIWVVTTQGLDRLHDMKVTTYTKAEGLNADLVASVVAGSDGTIWIGNEGSLDVITQGVASSIRPKDGLPGLRVMSLLQDSRGTLWVGVDDQLYIYHDRKFLKIEPPEGGLMGPVQSLGEDMTHDIWAVRAVPGSVIRIRGQRVIESYPFTSPFDVASDAAGGVFVTSREGLADVKDGAVIKLTNWSPGAPLRDRLHVDHNGVLWNTSPSGLIARKDDVDKVFGIKAGLPCAKVYAMVELRNGDFWLSQPCGYTHIAYQQIQSVLHGDSVKWHAEVLDSFDGAEPGDSPFSPAGTLAPDGTIWFATQTGLQKIDPGNLHKNSVAPPVHIEEVVADHKRYDPRDNLELPAHTRDLEVNFTALSLAVPQKVQFRYMLEGWDSKWQDPGSRRQAFYTNLGPGTYVFRVRASNQDGVWNEHDSTLRFAMAPAFYQTKKFALFTAFCMLAFLYLAYLFRLRSVTAQIKRGFLERIAERERIARDLHDTFFQGIQGLLLHFNSGTNQLKEDEPAKAIFVEALRKSDQVMLEGRELVLDLRATTRERLDLPTSITALGDNFGKSFSSSFTMVVTGQMQALHSVCFEELYRIAREALYNAFRHAYAERIEAELDYNPVFLNLTIRDDGSGIDEEILQSGARDGHWGLPGMQERARKLGAMIVVRSKKNGGTEVEVSVPASIAYAELKSRSSLARLKAILTQWHSSEETSNG